eukprot:scaffold323_cov232-Pinguiococcus_pyrenoidosus.AAC.10
MSDETAVTHKAVAKENPFLNTRLQKNFLGDGLWWGTVEEVWEEKVRPGRWVRLRFLAFFLRCLAGDPLESHPGDCAA